MVMCKLSTALVICLTAMAAASCHRLIPPTRPPFTITGVVESAATNSITLRHKTGQRVAIALSPGTVVTRRSRPADVVDIQVGMRIVVWYHLVDGAAVADNVQLFRTG